MTRELATSDQLVSRLEELTQAVIDALVAVKVDEIQYLVMEQCICLQQLSAFRATDVDTDRLRDISQLVAMQQSLIVQALRTTDYFMLHFNQVSLYNETC